MTFEEEQALYKKNIENILRNFPFEACHEIVVKYGLKTMRVSNPDNFGCVVGWEIPTLQRLKDEAVKILKMAYCCKSDYSETLFRAEYVSQDKGFVMRLIFKPFDYSPKFK